MSEPLDLDPITTRHHLTLDASACGTCRRLAADGKAPEHPECARRAVLMPAPDAPDYETLIDTPEDERTNLPARFHTPVWEGNATPNAWLCAVCWGDGWVTIWPCEAAAKNGGQVFTAEHHAERARWDGAQLLAEVRRLRAELARTRDVLKSTQESAAQDPPTCLSCGHIESAHDPDGERDCHASGAQFMDCSCSYFIPCYPAPAAEGV